jgi:predicted acylesterase/phospholipase RssA
MLSVSAALSLSLGAIAEEAPREAEVSPQSYVLPISVIAQIEHCRGLVETKEDPATVTECFHYASLLLEEGMRRRQMTKPRSERFEYELRAGAREIAERLDALSHGDHEEQDQGLRALDEAILQTRTELSRLAAAERMQLSLVSRGGVSLGNWQAGFLYSVTEWGKTRPGMRVGPSVSDPAFSTVTGASAGAVNGFAAAVEGCRPPNLSASDSLYYRVWMDLGLFGRHGKPGLFPKEDGATALSLFTGDALDATLEMAKSSIENGEQLPSCSVDFGFVATHMHPEESPVHVRQDGNPILSTKKLKEKFAVRLEFSDASSADPGSRNKALEIVNIGPTGAHAGDQIFYAGLGHEKDVPLQSLMMAVRASGAFPVAFPPVPLAYTQFVPGPGDTVMSNKKVATFIDGGILDNTPVGLAVALDEWRGESAHADPYLEGLVPMSPRTYVFLEPLVRSWVLGETEQAKSKAKKKDLVSTYLAFAGNLLATTTDAQLSNTAEEFSFVRRESEDRLGPRLSVPERHMPITGAQFQHFMAFLERDFRIFDFYVGMADAYVYLQREGCLLAEEGGSCDPDGNLGRLDAALQDANPKYRCIRAYYDSEASRVLSRIRTSDLPAECAALTAAVCEELGGSDDPEAVAAFLESGVILAEGDQGLCMESAISDHNFRALLAGMHNYKVWMQSEDYSHTETLDRFFDELSGGDQSERFIYVDLPTHLERTDGYMGAREAKLAFRSLLQHSIDEFSKQQKGLGKYALKLGGRPVADMLFGKDYPRQILGLAVAQSGLELSYGRRLGRSPWRWDSAFRFFNIGSQSFSPDLEPTTGEFYLSTQVTRVFSFSSFVDMELGAGWAASETIALDSESPNQVAFRTGPRLFLGLVGLQRVFLGLNIDYYPINEVGDEYEATGTRVSENWALNIVAGWRFLF